MPICFIWVVYDAIAGAWGAAFFSFPGPARLPSDAAHPERQAAGQKGGLRLDRFVTGKKFRPPVAANAPKYLMMFQGARGLSDSTRREPLAPGLPQKPVSALSVACAAPAAATTTSAC